MIFTAFPGARAPQGQRAEVTWGDFLAWVRAPTVAADKASLSGFSLATFKGDYRKSENVEQVHALLLDDDKSRTPASSHAAAWSAFRGVVFSTHSSTPERPKSRIVLVPSRPMAPDEYRRVWSFFAAGRGFDPAPKDPSRFWFRPAVKPGAPFEVHELGGAPFDVDAVLAQAPPEQPVTPLEQGPGAPAADTQWSAAAGALAAAWPAEGRHQAQLALAGALCRDGWSAEDALEFLCEVCRAAGNEDRPKRQQTIAHTYERAARGETLTGWTSLAPHVGRPVVAAARALLDPEAEDRADFAELVQRAAQAPGGALAQPAALAAPDGHWSAAIRRGAAWAEPYVRPPYLLDGLIPKATVTTWYAEGGSVKSWAAFSLAISVATGLRWLGNGVQRGRVLILDYEDGWEEYKRRKGILTAATPMLDLGQLEYLYAGPQITQRDLWVWLAGQGYSLIVVDALNAAMPGDADENDQRFAEGLKLAGRFVEATGTNVLDIHHANKTGGMRGAGSLRDQSDVVFRFDPVSETETTKRMRMVCDKAGPQRKPKPVNIELTDNGLGTFEDDVEVPLAAELTVTQQNDAALLAIRNKGVDGQGVHGYVDLMDAVPGMTQARARKTIARLSDRGVIFKGLAGYEIRK